MKHNYSMDGFAYRLRPIKKTDAQFVVDVRLEDQERNRFIHKISSDVTLQEKWLDDYFEREGDYYFIIENKLTRSPEGLISFYDVCDGKAEWGRWVIKKDSLAAPESVDLLYRIAFEKAGLKELYCRTLAANESVVAFHNSIGEHTRCVIPEAFELEGVKYDAVEQFADKDIFYSEIHPKLEKTSEMTFRRNFKMLVGKFELHHIGVAVKDIEKDFSVFSLLGYTKESQVFEDETQGIRGLFLTSKNQPRLELLMDINESGTVAPYLKNGNKMYHFAYTVSNIEKALDIFVKCRAQVISPLKESTYFGKRICFLMLPNMYMIELVEE